MKIIANRTFVKLLILLNFLNIYDAALTSIWVSFYGAIEINPVMDYLLSLGHPIFIVVKTGIVLLVSLLMWKNRNKGYTNLVLVMGLIFYTCLTLYEFTLSAILLFQF